MSFKRQVAYNTIIQLTGKAVAILLSVIITIALTRHFGPTGYGYYNTVITFVGFFIVLADLGVYPILVREMSQRPKEKEQIYATVFFYRVISSLVTMGFAFLVGFLMPYPQLVKLAIGIYALSAFLSLLISLIMAVFQINYRMDLPTFVEISSRILYLFTLLWGLKQGYNLYGIFWLLVVATVVNLVLDLALSQRYMKTKIVFDFELLKGFLKESLPMGLATILGLIHFKVDTILLSVMKPAADVGIYGAAYRIFENLIIIPGIFVGLLFPRLSELYLQDSEGLRRVFQKAIDLLLMAVLPTIVIFYFLSPYLIETMAGPQFAPAHLALRILLASLFATFLVSLFSYLCIASKKQKILIYLWAAFSLLNILLNLLFIPLFSYKGAALTTVVTEFGVLFTLYFIVNNLIRIRPSFGFLGRLFLPTAFLILFYLLIFRIPTLSFATFQKFSLLVQFLYTTSLLLLGFLLYGLLLIIFQVVDRNEILEIIRRGRQSR